MLTILFWLFIGLPLGIWLLGLLRDFVGAMHVVATHTPEELQQRQRDREFTLQAMQRLERVADEQYRKQRRKHL